MYKNRHNSSIQWKIAENVVYTLKTMKYITLDHEIYNTYTYAENKNFHW